MAKNFSWSYSKYKNFDTCPKRHYEVDIAKNYTDSSEALDWGNEVHSALAASCQTGKPLPDTMLDYQMWVKRYSDAGGLLPGQLYTERQYAMKKDFTPTGWKDWNGAWVRGIVDVLRIYKDVAWAADWKTGKVLHDSRQLMINAQVIFANHPQVWRIKTEFVWLKENDINCTTPEVFDRRTIHREWPPVLDHVRQMEQAAATLDYPPKPGKLCARYCPVQSCPFHGKRQS